jgi:O-acetyl-ADP-ribose deacetylase (regulator of RNase III)
MITFTQGNLLEAKAEALVNTVNTVGVMGKGIALMFKERFDANFSLYAAACKAKQVQTGKMFITEPNELDGPRWIVNFPTKQHWRSPSRLEWVIDGLQDLRHFLIDQHVQSIAIPPLGAGNGGLDWDVVKPEIEKALGDLSMDVVVFEPTTKYQNVAKRAGVEKLTVPRALVAEMIRYYWVLGMECSLLEIQKLAWFMERAIEAHGLDNSLDLRFEPNNFGPYSNRLSHLLNGLDGSYLHCDKRLADANALDVISFDDGRKDRVQAFLKSEGKAYLPALDDALAMINGFESPFGMELLATVDWLLTCEGVAPTVEAVRHGIRNWRGGAEAARRKDRLFDDRALGIALQRLTERRLAT